VQASAVAPVVRTSSTSRILWPRTRFSRIDRDLEGRPAAGAERVGEEVELGPEVRLERAGTGEFAVSEQRALGPDDGGEAGAATMSLRLTLWP